MNQHNNIPVIEGWLSVSIFYSTEFDIHNMKLKDAICSNDQRKYCEAMKICMWYMIHIKRPGANNAFLHCRPYKLGYEFSKKEDISNTNPRRFVMSGRKVQKPDED